MNILKASKMKELVFKRQNELEEIYRGVHMDVDSDAARQILISLIDSGINPALELFSPFAVKLNFQSNPFLLTLDLTPIQV